MTTPAPRRAVSITAVPGIPRIQPGDPLTAILIDALEAEGVENGDVITVTSKLFSRAQGRFVLLTRVKPSARAIVLAAEVDKDPALVELILQESTAVSRQKPGVLITRHRLGMICANAGIDRSNALPHDAPEDTRGLWALLLPRDPDADADALRQAIADRLGKHVGVVITDSHGRPFRSGTVGIAIGAAGVKSLDAHQGRVDLDGRPLEVTVTAVVDQLAAAADLVAGQADEGAPLVIIRGLRFDGQGRASDLIRDPESDLYA